MLIRRTLQATGILLVALTMAAMPMATPADAGAPGCIASASAEGGPLDEACSYKTDANCQPTGHNWEYR